MTVLEFAIFSIKSPHTVETPELISALKNALQVLNKASGFLFSLHQQTEDPSILYLLGSWTSVEAHHVFLPSPENQALLEDAKDLINVDLLFHAEIEKSALPLGAPCVAIGRHSIKAGQKEAFTKTWGESKHHLEEFTKPYPLVAGWRIDGVEEGAAGEWVQFSGFESVEHHWEFAKTEGFQEYGRVREFLGAFEVKHMKALGW